MNRRAWKYLFVMMLLALGVWAGSESLRDQRQSLEALVEPETKAGWRVARPPERAGPYLRGENPLHVARGAVSSVTYASPGGPVSIRLPVREDIEQMVVPLLTADGAVTVVVLER